MKSLILISLISSVICSGCFLTSNNKINTNVNVSKSDKISALVVGVSKSPIYGYCMGADYDTHNMKNFLSNFTTNITVLADEDANIKNFSAGLNHVIKNDLAIIYYSGHGGSHVFNDNYSTNEVDGVDEFLCLYDGGYRDDSIWNIIKKSKGRVLLIFDCCHSETMFRWQNNVSFNSGIFKAEIMPNLLCWSGCEDDAESYGSRIGGKFTNLLLSKFNKDYSYEELWNILKSDKTLKRQQTIKETKLGNFDIKQKSFR